MGVLGAVLLVFFIIIAILLILLVLAQNEEGDSLGGIFAGGSASAFGSRSGNVLTRATTVLGALFLIISLGLALVNRSPGGSGVENIGRQLAPQTSTNWWQEDPLAEDTYVPGIPMEETSANPDSAFQGAGSPSDNGVSE
jgi:preprotein translocase subunit SecG